MDFRYERLEQEEIRAPPAILQDSRNPGYEFWPSEMRRIHLPHLNGVEVLDTLMELSLQTGPRRSQFASLDEGLLELVASFCAVMPQEWPEAWRQLRVELDAPGQGPYFYSYPPKWPPVHPLDPSFIHYSRRVRLFEPSLMIRLRVPLLEGEAYVSNTENYHLASPAETRAFMLRQQTENFQQAVLGG